MAKREFTLLFALVCFIAAFHYIAVEFYLYWHYWWFDIVMHGLGGLWVALIALWLYCFSRFSRKSLGVSRHSLFAIAVGSTVLIGVGWEIFEYVSNLTFVLPFENYIGDTLADLAMDLAGSFLAYIHYVQKFRS
jgi:putative membrane protein